MPPTCFFSLESEAQQASDEKQAALGRIVGAIPRVDGPDRKNKSKAAAAAMAQFAERFPLGISAMAVGARVIGATPGPSRLFRRAPVG